MKKMAKPWDFFMRNVLAVPNSPFTYYFDDCITKKGGIWCRYDLCQLTGTGSERSDKQHQGTSFEINALIRGRFLKLVIGRKHSNRKKT